VVPFLGLASFFATIALWDFPFWRWTFIGVVLWSILAEALLRKD